jgi:hypothetical protein
MHPVLPKTLLYLLLTRSLCLSLTPPLTLRPVAKLAVRLTRWTLLRWYERLLPKQPQPLNEIVLSTSQRMQSEIQIMIQIIW